MAYIETTDGVPLYYRERGDGETIVLVHGWTCDSEYWWRKNVDALAEEYHVLTYDLRGHGLSGKTDDGHTLSEYAADLEFLMESLDVSAAVLVGWSMGAAITLTYLEEIGDERVRAIAMIDQTPKFYSDDDWSSPSWVSSRRRGSPKSSADSRRVAPKRRSRSSRRSSPTPARKSDSTRCTPERR
ncbi:alpha/beta hydrolase [Natronococcus sp. A-GB7]|uniref:alpha/beta fold hydrolase n=1 Tax=Natronococcus sp. A-GB7 TaxID=3037649 RepID=UPI00241BF249|nr:alpha/beta hydrolase [Natronococcus sp. A-GB7]MDG5818546.1 alpha/beta hydrolase [Natronococcus sp. A-GB7]